MADNKSNEQLIKELQAQLQKSQDESAAKDAIIAGQEEALAAATKQGEGQLSVVTHEGQQYQVLAGQFSIDDQVIKHDELKSKPEVLKKLVKEKSPLLQLIEKPKAEKKA